MKTRLLILTSIIALVALLSSCEDMRKDKLRSFVTSLQPYYPYTLNEEFVFVNDKTGQVWSAKPSDPYNFGYYPYSYIEDQEKDWGFWRAGKEAYMLVDSVLNPLPDRTFITTLIHGGRGQEAEIIWDVQLQVDENTCYYGRRMYETTKSKVITCLPDTIEVVLGNYHTIEPNDYSRAPYGTFLHIVKGQGFTDFSVDGETVWRRVVKNE